MSGTPERLKSTKTRLRRLERALVEELADVFLEVEPLDPMARARDVIQHASREILRTRLIW